MARLAKCRRRPLRNLILREWESRGWLVGTWILDYDGEDNPIQVTTSAKNIGMKREVMRFKVVHKDYRYVFYTE